MGGPGRSGWAHTSSHGLPGLAREAHEATADLGTSALRCFGQHAERIDSTIELAVGQHQLHSRVDQILAQCQGQQSADQPQQKTEEQAQRSGLDDLGAGSGQGYADGDVAAKRGDGADNSVAT